MAKYYHPLYKRFYTTDSGKIYNSKTGRELLGTPTKNGFIQISIRPRGKNPISLLAHEFIWESYNNKETTKYFKIIHIDENKLNNEPVNLKQVINKSSNPSNIKKQILATNLTTGKTRTFDSIYITSKMLQINSGSIKLIADGKRKTATSKLNNDKYTFKYNNSNDLNIVKINKDKEIENYKNLKPKIKYNKSILFVNTITVTTFTYNFRVNIIKKEDTTRI